MLVWHLITSNGYAQPLHHHHYPDIFATNHSSGSLNAAWGFQKELIAVSPICWKEYLSQYRIRSLCSSLFVRYRE